MSSNPNRNQMDEVSQALLGWYGPKKLPAPTTSKLTAPVIEYRERKAREPSDTPLGDALKPPAPCPSPLDAQTRQKLQNSSVRSTLRLKR